MRCEICDRDSRAVHNAAEHYYEGAWCNGMPNPYPGPLPNGDGWGWIVRFSPWMPVLVAVAVADPSSMTTFMIMTCGDEVCRFRARHHGVPGRLYERPVDPSRPESLAAAPV
jgi:hypothetical protein